MFKFTSSFRVPVLVFGLAILFSVTACMPRGETKSLDELLASARSKFTSIDKSGISQNAGTALKQVESGLENLIGNSSGAKASETAQQISSAIAELIPHAGYTSRPGFGELASQLRNFNATGADSRTVARAKLIASRTYEAMYAELSTTKFGID